MTWPLSPFLVALIRNSLKRALKKFFYLIGKALIPLLVTMPLKKSMENIPTKHQKHTRYTNISITFFIIPLLDRMAFPGPLLPFPPAFPALGPTNSFPTPSGVPGIYNFIVIFKIPFCCRSCVDKSADWRHRIDFPTASQTPLDVQKYIT